jgi:hypothetical protein
MKRINAILVMALLALASGCATTPGGSTAINDQLLVLNTQGIAGLGIAALPVADQAPAAQAGYEVALAINTAAKNGISPADLAALANDYLGKVAPAYSNEIATLIAMILDDAQAISGSPATAEPSTQPSAGEFQEAVEDISQGVMNACLPLANATPTADVMSVESHPGSKIVVRHLRWTPR